MVVLSGIIAGDGESGSKGAARMKQRFEQECRSDRKLIEGATSNRHMPRWFCLHRNALR